MPAQRARRPGPRRLHPSSPEEPSRHGGFLERGEGRDEAGGKLLGAGRHHPGQALRWRIELVTYHLSGKHGRVVRGINLITLLWTDGEALVPATSASTRAIGGPGDVVMRARIS